MGTLTCLSCCMHAWGITKGMLVCLDCVSLLRGEFYPSLGEVGEQWSRIRQKISRINMYVIIISRPGAIQAIYAQNLTYILVL